MLQEVTMHVNEETHKGKLNWWMQYGRYMIVDNNGFLLGKYIKLDEDMNIT